MNPSALQPRPPRKSLFFALAETIVRALLPENPSHKEDTHAPTNHQAFYPLVAKWLTETKAELTAAIYFPLLGLRRILPQQDFRVIRRRPTKQLYAITLEMIIEEGEDVVIARLYPLCDRGQTREQMFPNLSREIDRISPRKRVGIIERRP